MPTLLGTIIYFIVWTMLLLAVLSVSTIVLKEIAYRKEDKS